MDIWLIILGGFLEAAIFWVLSRINPLIPATLFILLYLLPIWYYMFYGNAPIEEKAIVAGNIIAINAVGGIGATIFDVIIRWFEKPSR